MISKIMEGELLVSAVQAGSPFTVWMKAATSALMHAEYCATVAAQVVGMSLQPGLLAQGSVCWQAACCPEQLSRRTDSEGALLDAAKDSPFHLHVVASGMALP